MVVSILGGMLGILAMIPLRRAFIVKMHGRPGQPGTLLYPEGTACAQVLISGEKGGTTGATVFVGFGIAFVHKFLTDGHERAQGDGQLSRSRSSTRRRCSPATWPPSCSASATSSACGPASIMMAGAVLGYLVIIPIIYFIGEHAPAAIPPSSDKADHAT